MNSQPMGVKDMLKTPDEIAKAGWSVVIPGGVYRDLCEVMIQLINHYGGGEGKHNHEQFNRFFYLQTELLKAKPVKAKLR